MMMSSVPNPMYMCVVLSMAVRSAFEFCPEDHAFKRRMVQVYEATKWGSSESWSLTFGENIASDSPPRD